MQSITPVLAERIADESLAFGDAELRDMAKELVELTRRAADDGEDSLEFRVFIDGQRVGINFGSVQYDTRHYGRCSAGEFCAEESRYMRYQAIAAAESAIVDALIEALDCEAEDSR